MLESETDVGVGCGIWKRDSVGVSKDIAESPTAERSGDGTPKERRLQVNKTTSCWGDVVFTEKNREYSCGFVDGGFEDFRDLGIKGAEGLEGVTSLHYYITPLLKKFKSQSSSEVLVFYQFLLLLNSLILAFISDALTS